MAAEHDDHGGILVPCSVSTKEVLLRLIDDFENISKELIDNIASVASQRGPKNDLIQHVSETVEKLIEKDKEIQMAVKVGEKQIVKQQQIIQIKDEISRKDQEILQLQSQLRDAEQILANALFEAKRKLDASRQANGASVSSENLIKFAFRISSSNAVEAPSDWQQGDPRRPYPLDFIMRRGWLGHMSQQSRSGLSADDDYSQALDPTLKEDQTASSVAASNSSRPNNPGVWSLSEQTNEVYQQILDNKEQPYAMVSANAIQPPIFNGEERPVNTDDVELMSTSSDSSSSDSP
ncbi:mediator of RNA polymerase II transcription subunit 4-like isoform X2 [Rhopilema esculentum]|uniref:mediator of RNA polymerase II transcription subunit 4-like isoform X2 n=1 Tax=Rhopilema esculentum TaxID=499914 RepID=UPI0031DD755B